MLHPVFFTSNFSRSIELKDGNDPNKPEITRAKVIREYLDVPPSHTVAEWGQPTLQVRISCPVLFLIFNQARVGLFPFPF